MQNKIIHPGTVPKIPFSWIKSVYKKKIVDSPINDQILINRLLITHWTVPRGFPFIHLKIETCIEALQVRTGRCSTWCCHSHLPQRTDQWHSQHCGGNFTICILLQFVLNCKTINQLNPERLSRAAMLQIKLLSALVTSAALIPFVLSRCRSCMEVNFFTWKAKKKG